MNSFSGGSRYAASEERWKEEIIHHLRPADYNKALKKSTTWSSQSTFDHHLVENENSLITSVNRFVNSTLKSLDLAISTPQCCSRRQCSQSRDVCTNHCFHCVQRMGCCVMLLLCNTIYNKLPLANLDEISRCCQYPLNKYNILIDAIVLKLGAAHFQSGQAMN